MASWTGHTEPRTRLSEATLEAVGRIVCWLDSEAGKPFYQLQVDIRQVLSELVVLSKSKGK